MITTCDFCVSYSFPNKIKPFPFRQLDFIQTQEIVNSIINSVDRFYTPRTTCRRCFNIYAPFVTKYYPNCVKSLKKQISFLHKSQNLNISNNFFKDKKSVSLFDISSMEYFYNIRDFKNHSNLIKICQDFLIEERFSFNKLIGNYNIIPQYAYNSNFVDVNSVGAVKRLNGSGKGFARSYRKSFPLMVSRVGLVSLGIY